MNQVFFRVLQNNSRRKSVIKTTGDSICKIFPRKDAMPVKLKLLFFTTQEHHTIEEGTL